MRSNAQSQGAATSVVLAIGAPQRPVGTTTGALPKPKTRPAGRNRPRVGRNALRKARRPAAFQPIGVLMELPTEAVRMAGGPLAGFLEPPIPPQCSQCSNDQRRSGRTSRLFPRREALAGNGGSRQSSEADRHTKQQGLGRARHSRPDRGSGWTTVCHVSGSARFLFARL